MLIEDYYKTPEEKILENLNQIMNRLDNIEKKLDQLNDPYNLNDYFGSHNTIAYKLSDHFDSTGEPING